MLGTSRGGGETYRSPSDGGDHLGDDGDGYDDLLEALTAEFEVDNETARHDLATLLADLHTQLAKA